MYLKATIFSYIKGYLNYIEGFFLLLYSVWNALKYISHYHEIHFKLPHICRVYGMIINGQVLKSDSKLSIDI